MALTLGVLGVDGLFANVRSMGFYNDSIVPRLVSVSMQGRLFRDLREKALASLEGQVLEVGFGSGLNLPFYPDAVGEVLALEPSKVGRKLARKRIAAAPMEVSFVGLRGEEIPLDSASIDTVVSTWTLCTIPDLPKALSEIRRVMKPAARFHFLEHGLSESPSVVRWQRRLNTLQMTLCGGCRLDRKIDEQVSAAGFAIEDLETFTLPGPKTHGAMYSGVARLA